MPQRLDKIKFETSQNWEPELFFCAKNKALYEEEEMVAQRGRERRRASDAVREAGPVHSPARIGIMSVCWGNIYL